MVFRAQVVIVPLVCDLHSPSFNPVVLCLRAYFDCRSRLGPYKETPDIGVCIPQLPSFLEQDMSEASSPSCVRGPL